MSVHKGGSYVRLPDGRVVPNAAAMHAQGPLVPIFVGVPTAVRRRLEQEGRPVPAPVQGRALIDTGATNTSIDRTILATKLGLQPIGREKTLGAHGEREMNAFACSILIPGMEPMDLARTISVELQGAPIIALLGRDFLFNKVLIYDGAEGSFTLCL